MGDVVSEKPSWSFPRGHEIAPGRTTLRLLGGGNRCEVYLIRDARSGRRLVAKVRNAAIDGGFGDALPRAVAINYAKLLAYKDEYEVARLFSDGRFVGKRHEPTF